MRHKKKIRHFIALCAVLVVTNLTSLSVFAAGKWPSEVTIEADGGILMDADTGTILYGKNSNEAYYPASITKLLTAQVVLDRCSLDETVEFSKNAVYNVEQGSKSLSMDTGDRLSVKDALYGMLLHSANEVANALAEHAAGSVEEFAVLMNEKARKLGCTGSNFVNPSGLNDPDHYTTAYDMALIARGALDYPEIIEIMGTRLYHIPPSKKAPEGQNISPGHKMLRKNDPLYDPDVFGGKTGFTSLAGNTLVTYAKRDGMTLIAVILNGHQTHYTDTKRLLDFGFGEFRSVRLADCPPDKLVPLNELTFSDSEAEQSLLLLNQNSRIILPKDADAASILSNVSYDETPLTPEGTVVTIDYLYGARTVGHAWMAPNPAIENRLKKAAPRKEEGEKLAGLGSGSLPSSSILLFSAAVVLGGASGTAFYLIRRRRLKEAESAAVRKQRREQWMQGSGCSAEEFEALFKKNGESFGKRRRR